MFYFKLVDFVSLSFLFLFCSVYGLMRLLLSFDVRLIFRISVFSFFKSLCYQYLIICRIRGFLFFNLFICLLRILRYWFWFFCCISFFDLLRVTIVKTISKILISYVNETITNHGTGNKFFSVFANVVC